MHSEAISMHSEAISMHSEANSMHSEAIAPRLRTMKPPTLPCSSMYVSVYPTMLIACPPSSSLTSWFL
jgi:hypothetical protein